MQDAQQPPADALLPSASDRRSLPFVICLVTFAALNLAVPAAANSAVSPALRAFSIGQLVGQLAWLAVWVVLGPARWPVRLLLAVAAEAVLYGTWVLGMGIGTLDTADLSSMFRALPILPLALLSTALPLLFLRAVTGWQIAQIGRSLTAQPDATRRFSIRDLFAVTAVVAVSLALSRVGLKWLAADSDASGIVVVLSLVLAGLSSFLSCPCVWSSLRAGSVALGSLIVIAYAAALGTLGGWSLWLLTFAQARGNSGVRVPYPGLSESIWVVIWFNVAAVLCLHGGLVLARKCGYTLLQMPRRRSRAGPQTEAGTPGKL